MNVLSLSRFTMADDGLIRGFIDFADLLSPIGVTLTTTTRQTSIEFIHVKDGFMKTALAGSSRPHSLN